MIFYLVTFTNKKSKDEKNAIHIKLNSHFLCIYKNSHLTDHRSKWSLILKEFAEYIKNIF